MATPNTPNQIKRVRVKFLDSIAGLRDPRPEELEARYKRLGADMARQRRPDGLGASYSASAIAQAIEEERRRDAAAVPLGFTKDWCFKMGEEGLVNQVIAEEWEAAGICIIIREPGKKDAA
ncbi:MAG TPA: hypothetical protein VKU19_14895 [Bryobacteraceae bacterium]|nr:hypothetical protein [Bryobacteraceae bacterium]